MITYIMNEGDPAMFRLWCKTLNENNGIINEVTVVDETDLNRTKKVLNCLSKACEELDLAEPIWLESNIREFKTHSKTRFRKDNFMESVPFEYMEIQVIEED